MYDPPVQDNYNLNKLSPDNHLKVDNDYLDKTLTDEIDTIKDFSGFPCARNNCL